MPSWSAIALSVSAGFVLCLLLIVVGLRFFLKRLLKGLLAVATASPVRITPQSLGESPIWKKPREVKEARDFFEARGFRVVEHFQIEEFDGLICCGLLSSDGVAAVLYDHSQLGFWIDLVELRGERGGLTVSSQELAGKLKEAPFTEKCVLPGASSEALWEVFSEKRLSSTAADFRPIEASTYLREFERSYADEMDWRNAQGGPSRDEVRRVLEAGGNSPSEKEIDEAWDIQSTQARFGLAEGLSRRSEEMGLVEASHSSALVFVHDQLREEDLFLQLIQTVEDDEYEPTGFIGEKQGLTPREAFEVFQQSLPENLRFRAVGKLDFPLETDVYLPPQGGLPVEVFPHRKLDQDC